MNSRTRAVVLSLLVITSIGLAGCTDGWGEDGPATNDDGEQEQEQATNNTSENTTNTTTNTSTTQQNNSTDSATIEKEDSPDASPTPDEVNDAIEDNENENQDETETDDTSTQSDDSSSDSEDDSQPVTDTDSDESEQTDSDSDSDPDTDSGSDSSDSSDDSSSDEDTNSDDREVHTLTVRAGPGGSMAGIPVTIERHADGATTTRETNENGVVEFSVYSGDYTVTATDPGGNTDEQQVSVYGPADITLNNLEPGTTDQYAYPDSVEVVSVEHDTANEDLDVDTVTIVNTHEELPVSIANWRVKTQDDVPTASLDGGEVLAPGEERTIQLRSNSLHPDGGILTLYDGNLDYVGQHGYAGSPGAPPASGESETHTLVVYPYDDLTDERRAGEVTVNGETKTAEGYNVEGDEHDGAAAFELTDGTYTVTSSPPGTDEEVSKEVTIDGEDKEVGIPFESTLDPPQSENESPTSASA